MGALAHLVRFLNRAGSILMSPAPDPRELHPVRTHKTHVTGEMRTPETYGPIRTPEDIRARLARLEHGEPRDLARIESVLADGFRRLPFEPGATALHSLRAHYARFVVTTRRLDRSRIAHVDYMQRLAEDALRHGLAALLDAYELTQVLQTMDSQRLARDLDVLAKEVERLNKEGALPELIDLKEQLLKSYKERLQIIRGHEVRVQAFLNQCEHCEAALERAGIEISQMRSESAPQSLASTIEALRATVESAQKQGAVADSRDDVS